MKICVLGASGFIGQTLCPSLERAHTVVKTDFRLEDREKALKFFNK